MKWPKETERQTKKPVLWPCGILKVLTAKEKKELTFTAPEEQERNLPHTLNSELEILTYLQQLHQLTH